MIALEEIHKSFDTLHVLKGVSLAVREGGVTALIGPSGSGKSTLLRCVNLLEIPQSGRVTIDDRSIAFSPGVRATKAEVLALRRKTGMVFQNFQLFPHLTAIENVMESLVTVLGWPRDKARARAAELLEKVGMSPKAEAWPANLSGGQQQRVAIGRALAKGARVLVLDEPLVNLDYKLREELEVELRNMLTDGALTVVYTTSDPRDAFNLGDEVLLLDDQRILQSGPPVDVYRAPVSPAAADLMSDPGVNRYPDGERLYVVRPEHLRIEPVGDPERYFELAVLTVETNGSETYLHGAVAGEHWVAKLPGLHRIEPGERVRLRVAQSAVLEFAERG